MTIDKFTRLYTAQIEIGKLIDVLTLVQHPNIKIITELIKEADRIGTLYENDSMSDAHWLKTPLPLFDAFVKHQSL